MVKQGNEVTLTAPVAGYIRQAAAKSEEGRASPVAGLAVQKDQELLTIEPVLSPVEQIQFAALKRSVENELAKARESVLVADLELKRVLDLHSQKLRGLQELHQNQVQLGVSRRRLEAAWKLLATAVGVPELSGNFVRGCLEAAPPVYDWQPVLETVLSGSSEVQEAQALVLQAEQLLKRAEVEVCPNLILLVRPFYAFPDQTTQLKVEVGAVLPIFDRNQGNIRAARADLARIREEVRQVELHLTDRLTSAFQRYLPANRCAWSAWAMKKATPSTITRRSCNRSMFSCRSVSPMCKPWATFGGPSARLLGSCSRKTARSGCRQTVRLNPESSHYSPAKSANRVAGCHRFRHHSAIPPNDYLRGRMDGFNKFFENQRFRSCQNPFRQFASFSRGPGHSVVDPAKGLLVGGLAGKYVN